MALRGLKIPDTGSHIIIHLFGHTTILHAPIGMGSAAHAAAVDMPKKGKPNFPQGTIIMKHLNFIFRKTLSQT